MKCGLQYNTPLMAEKFARLKSNNNNDKILDLQLQVCNEIIYSNKYKTYLRKLYRDNYIIQS